MVQGLGLETTTLRRVMNQVNEDAMDQESMNEKRIRMARERAIREALDQIHEMGRYWNSDKAYEEAREKAVALLLKAIR